MEHLKTLPLDQMHRRLGAKMVPFAGYEMPVQYPMGVKAEHLHTRSKAGLFDVSHMGQAVLSVADGAHADVAVAIETLVPGEIRKLPKGRIRYTVLLADDGGILDDLMISRYPEEEDAAGRLFLVVNAAVKDQDYAYIEEKLAGSATLDVLDRALLALQGPTAVDVIKAHIPEAETMPFMSMRRATLAGVDVFVSRCGYTGEDGFEISVDAAHAETVAVLLLASDDVEPIGLGARDSLRLEAGLCLYGHDMSPKETPVEADLTFTIGKRRRAEGGFAGADRVLAQLEDGAEKVRVGIQPLGRAPAREGVEIADRHGQVIGVVTSGGFGPTVEGPIAMGYVPSAFATIGTEIHLLIRGKAVPAKVAALPFAPHRYFRSTT